MKGTIRETLLAMEYTVDALAFFEDKIPDSMWASSYADEMKALRRQFRKVRKHLEAKRPKRAKLAKVKRPTRH